MSDNCVKKRIVLTFLSFNLCGLWGCPTFSSGLCSAYGSDGLDNVAWFWDYPWIFRHLTLTCTFSQLFPKLGIIQHIRSGSH